MHILHTWLFVICSITLITGGWCTSSSSSTISKPPKYHEYRYTVPLDHFDFSNKAKFDIRYLVSHTKEEVVRMMKQRRQTLNATSSTLQYKFKPVMIFYTGNEGPIELFYNNAGFMTKTLANKWDAITVFAEHRFFGKSFPKKEFDEKPSSSSSLSKSIPWQYCTVEQTLRDYAQLIEYLQSPHQFNTKFQVIAGGGSYGGMLSAWFRQHYPNTVFAALAASAPLYQYTNETKPSAFFGRVTKNVYDAGCGKQIRQAFGSISPWTEKQKKTKASLDDMKSGFNICKTRASEVTVRTFLIAWWQDLLTDLGMVNYPFESDFIRHITKGYPIKALCEVVNKKDDDENLTTLKNLRGNLLEESVTDTPLEIFKKMRKGADAIGVVKKGKCIDIEAELREKLMNPRGGMPLRSPIMMRAAKALHEMEKSEKGEAAHADGPLGDLTGWAYLVCTTQTMPMCTTGTTDFFPPSEWNVSEFEKGCKADFPFMQRKPDYNWPMVYEGHFEHCSHTIFSTGTTDPWDTGCLHQQTTPDCPILVVNEGGHHYDLREPDAKGRDTASVKAIRAKEISILDGWLQADSDEAATTRYDN